ncbi:MAG: MATE family efflux transporter [Lachnospiraceae bacterium]|nr:MATE family efflux transporter [Lachnospiraceae bacterium]
MSRKQPWFYKRKIEDRELAKQLIQLSVPTILEEILRTLFQYVDTAMVGQLGKQATAAVSVTTTITWLVTSVPSAIGVAVLTMVAKAVGCRDEAYIRQISKQLIFLTAGSGFILGLLSCVCSFRIPGWMGAETAIHGEASRYFLIVSLPMVFRAANSIFGAALRATKDTKTPMIINLTANLMNVLLNILLIYCLHLGVAGAAIASAVSYTFSGTMMFLAYRRNKLLFFPWKSLSRDGGVFKECVTVGMPVLGNSVVSCMGYVIFAALVSGMGTTVFAAHSLAVTAETCFYIPGYGLRTAASTMVGISLGEKNRKKFESISKISIGVTLLMMCATGCLLYIVALPLMELFTNNGQVAELGAAMLRLVAFSEPFFGLMIVAEGILFGLGKTRYPFLVESFGMWCVRIFLTFLVVKVFGLGLSAVWYCMIADNVVKSILLAIPIASPKCRERLFSTEESVSA